MASNAKNSEELQAAETVLRPTNGSARIVKAHDGEKYCLSLLLTEELVWMVNTIKRLVKERRSREDGAYKAQLDAYNTEREIQHLQEELDRARTRSQTAAILPRLEAARTGLASIKQHHKDIEANIETVEQALVLRRLVLESILERAFDDAHLMENDDPPASPIKVLPSKDQKLDQADSRHSFSSGDTDLQTPPLSPRSQELKNIMVKYQQAQDVHLKAEMAFANRKLVEMMDLVQRKRQLAEGVPREPQTVFDLDHLAQEMRLTRDLISATNQLKQCQEYAHAHEVYTASERVRRGPDPAAWGFAGRYTEPSYASDPGEIPKNPEMDTRIKGWGERMGSAGGYPGDQERMDVDLDEWDAETVRISESISMIDDDSWRRGKIDEWREMCGLHGRH